jgi:hypothetical protein
VERFPGIGEWNLDHSLIDDTGVERLRLQGLRVLSLRACVMLGDESVTWLARPGMMHTYTHTDTHTHTYTHAHTLT